MTLMLSSSAISDGEKLPPRYSKDGGNLSPPVAWSHPPEGTHSYALVVEDPDAPQGTFRHWAVYDLPSSQRALAEGAGSTAGGAALKMAVNDFGHRQYDGPQPPRGHGVHHYHFRLAALDVPRLDVPSGANAQQVWEAVKAHAIAQADLVGTFERR
jgi:Raf kinase inhibitor-like YbhB/YbcL family protein